MNEMLFYIRYMKNLGFEDISSYMFGIKVVVVFGCKHLLVSFTDMASGGICCHWTERTAASTCLLGFLSSL